MVTGEIFTHKLCRPIIALCTGLYLEGLIFTEVNQIYQAMCTRMEAYHCVEENES